MTKFRLAFFVFLSISILLAQNAGLLPFPINTTYNLYQRATYMPSTLTGLIGSLGTPQTVKVNYLLFANQSSSSTAVVTVTDQSNDCGGSQCQILPAVTLAPNTTYFVPISPNGLIFKNGFAWMATGSTTVFGYVQLSY